MLRAEMRPARDLGDDGFDNLGMRMSEDQRSVSSQIVDVLVAVGVPFS